MLPWKFYWKIGNDLNLSELQFQQYAVTVPQFLTNTILSVLIVFPYNSKRDES
jgi:hypothetical protein